MPKLVTLNKYLLLLLVILTPTNIMAVSKNDITPEQLILLVEASKKQYKSFDTHYERKSFQVVEGKLASEPYMISDVIWRWTPSRSFVNNIRTSNSNGGENTITKTYAFSSKWSKRLLQGSGSSKPRAIVDRDNSLKGELGMNIHKALWEMFNYDLLSIITNENSSVTRNEKTNNLILKAQVKDNGLFVELEIDPAKGYLPVRSRLANPGKTVDMECVCSEFKQVADELWVPLKYVWISSGEYEVVTTIKDVRVNVDIADELLDFPFPPGTIVTDRISNLHYVVKMVDAEGSELLMPEIEGTVQSYSTEQLKPQDIKITKPASNAELQEIAEQAQILHETQEASNAQEYCKHNILVLFVEVAIVFGLFFLIIWLFRNRKHQVRD